MALTRIASLSFPYRLGAFLLALAILWLPVAAPIYLLVSNTNTVSIATMSVLLVEFLLLLNFWGRRVYQQPLLQRYGLVAQRQNWADFLQGLAIAMASLFCLYIVQGLLGWLVWRSPSITFVQVVVEGLLVGVGVGVGEGLLFRGWLLDELQRDYKPLIVLWANGMAFACLHFIKPWQEIIQTSPQFLGLLLVGLILVWAKRACRGLMGLSIGFHAGLVWSYYIIHVGNLISYTRTVPLWVTGVNDNPLAGAIGLLFLGGLALYMRWRSLVNPTPQSAKLNK